jgi:hypothetical protein
MGTDVDTAGAGVGIGAGVITAVGVRRRNSDDNQLQNEFDSGMENSLINV